MLKKLNLYKICSYSRIYITHLRNFLVFFSFICCRIYINAIDITINYYVQQNNVFYNVENAHRNTVRITQTNVVTLFSRISPIHAFIECFRRVHVMYNVNHKVERLYFDYCYDPRKTTALRVSDGFTHKIWQTIFYGKQTSFLPCAL